MPATDPSPVVAPAAARRSGIPGTGTTLSIGLAAALVVVIGSVLLQSPAPAPSGAVLGLQPEETPVTPITGASQPAAGDVATAVALTVASKHLETWPDVLGAWHGQAIARVRNDGRVPLELVPGAAHATIRDGVTVLYDGTLDAAVPPVLQPGQDGYLVLGIPLAVEPDEPSVSIVPAGVPAKPLVELRVDNARAVPEPGRIVVTGTASNPSKDDVREGVVGAIAVDGAGVPVAAFMDRASLGRLNAGESRSFQATEPPAPPIRVGEIDELVVFAWGRADGD